MIVDTTFVIDLLRNAENAVAKAEELDEKGELVFATAVTIFELWQGVYIKNKEKLNDMERLIETFGLISLDTESAKRGGEIHSGLISKGNRIDAEDSMIAGIAIKNLQTLLTRDEHFARIKGLRIETY